MFGFYMTGFWLVPGIMEGLGRSGRLVGSISTYPGTYKCPGSRVMAKNLPGGNLFYRVRYIRPFDKLSQDSWTASMHLIQL